MSIPVSLADLGDALAQRASGYLLSGTETGRPHITHLSLAYHEGVFRSEVGARTAANVSARPAVALLWPPVEDGGYSLIVDGTATVEPPGDGEAPHLVTVTPIKAVLHRPAPAPPGASASCASDCIPLTT